MARCFNPPDNCSLGCLIAINAVNLLGADEIPSAQLLSTSPIYIVIRSFITQGFVSFHNIYLCHPKDRQRRTSPQPRGRRKTLKSNRFHPADQEVPGSLEHLKRRPQNLRGNQQNLKLKRRKMKRKASPRKQPL